MESEDNEFQDFIIFGTDQTQFHERNLYLHIDNKRINRSCNASNSSSETISSPTTTASIKSYEQTSPTERWQATRTEVLKQLNCEIDEILQIDTTPDIRPPRKQVSLSSELAFESLAITDQNSQLSDLQLGTLKDEEMKISVYKKTLQAMIYPISSIKSHNFISWTVTTPTYCYHCEGLLWGTSRQGLKCVNCVITCHKKCIYNLLHTNCFQKVKNTKGEVENKAENIIAAIKEIMKQREQEKLEVFELLWSVFDIKPESHVQHMEFVKEQVLNSVNNWSGKIDVAVICASGFTTCRPYVTIQVGKVKRLTKTTTAEDSISDKPIWNEKFTFECDNLADKIIVRVCDEENDVTAKILQKSIDETEDFLGEAIIDVQNLSGEAVIWFNLQKRQNENCVISGAIKMHVNIEIDSEAKNTPFHIQYTCLHENLFHTLYETNSRTVKIPQIDDVWNVYFDLPGQEIVDEFAMRYGIEKSYQAMTHFHCLSTKYLCPGVPAVLTSLLDKIIAHYTDKSISSTMTAKDRFATSNFGKEKFVNLLDKLNRSLSLDLKLGRSSLSVSNQKKLIDLKYIVQLLHKIQFFREKVLEQDSPPQASKIVEECILDFIKSTYRFNYFNCEHIYLRDFHVDETKSYLEETPLDFWHKLIVLLVNDIEHFRDICAPLLNQFSEKLDICQMSIATIWSLFVLDIKDSLDRHYHDISWKSFVYVNLYFKVKIFYDMYVKDVARYKYQRPEYITWFDPLIIQWLHEGGNVLQEILPHDLKEDAKNHFELSSEDVLYSTSLNNLVSRVTKCLNVVSKLECSNRENFQRYMEKFVEIVLIVFTGYADWVQIEFPQHLEDYRSACILMNNIRQLREKSRSINDVISGYSLEPRLTGKLVELEFELKNLLDDLAVLYTKNQELKITIAVQEFCNLLRTVEESQPDVSAKPDDLLKPVINLLEGSLQLYSEWCEKDVLKIVLEELWIVVIKIFEKTIVVPLIYKNIMSKSLTDNVKKFDRSDDVLRIFQYLPEICKPDDCLLSDKTKQFNLSPKQRDLLETALDTIRTCFYVSGNGVLEKSYLNENVATQNLKFSISFLDEINTN